jgi:TonB family protein
MKFLCPSCKAKYQIADEKVSGRSVRMKCRKCGFIIPISQVPPAPTTLQPAEGDLMSVVPKPPPPAQVTVQDVIAAPPKPERANPPGRLPAKPGVGTPLPRPASSPSAAPRPASSPSAAPRPGAPGARAPTPKPTPAPSAPVAESKPPATASSLMSALDVDDEDATRIVSSPYTSSPLASAFSDLVGSKSSTVGTDLDAAMPADEWFVGVNDVPVGPIRLSELRSKALSGAVTLDSLVWRDGQEDWRPLRTFPELVAIIEEGVSSVRASLAPLAVAAAQTAPKVEVADPFAPAAGVTGGGVVTDDFAPLGLARSRTPMAAWIAMVVALACGVTIGFVFFSSQKPPETIVKYVEVPAKAAEAPPVPAAQAAAETETANGTTPTGPSKPRSGTGNVGSKGTSGDTTKAGETKGGLSGLKGLSGLGPSGPAGTPGSEGAAKGGGGELDAAQLQSTVARYTSSVKRSCWQPALDARDPNAPTSARVVVSVTIAPSGSVSAVNTGADPKGYPGLSRCIAQRVKAWQFPPSSGTTTVNVPFVFAAQ